MNGRGLWREYSICPDVGANYFMNAIPGHAGRYLALNPSALDEVDEEQIANAFR